MKKRLWMMALMSCLLAWPLAVQAEMTLVRDGRPVAVVVVTDVNQRPHSQQRGLNTDDKSVAKILIEWIKKISDAELPLVEKATPGRPAIYVGKAAIAAGLRLDDIDSPSHEGVRIICDGKRVLLAGQDEISTVKAACRFLEELGCYYFMDIGPLGEVYPRKKTITIGKLDITEKPGFLLRKIWGSNWSSANLWKVWNGHGGIQMGTSHSWSRYVPNKDKVFAEHPEYFALRGGQRRKGGWYCTSNPELREIFARNVIKAIEAGEKNPSISPDDGVGYCECPACRAQDDPNCIEPSSGQVSVSNRYADFIDYVGRRVAKVYPDSILGFYCYADYTQPPTSGIKISPNVCAWIAPIRYCRFHMIGQKGCPSREQLVKVIDGWANAASMIGYRTYNYNLAECLVPFTLWKVWKHDIPYLKKKGCIGINLESLDNWAIYGPHLYLSLRLAYDPSADADAIMHDFFMKFYGKRAGKYVEQYWLAIAEAFEKLDCHTGSFYALHRVYTPEFLAKCRDLLDRAAAAARSNEKYAARVRIASEGLTNAEQYIQLRNAMNAGDFLKAKKIYDVLLARTEANNKAGFGNHYTVGYLRRFVGNHVLPGAALLQPPAKLVQVLPDRMKLAYDEQRLGEKKGYARPDFDDADWLEVATFSDPLNAQGLPDRQTVMWYRTSMNVPARHGKLLLHFSEVDGDTTVYVNGRKIYGLGQKTRRERVKTAAGKAKIRKVTYTEKTDVFPKRRPFTVDVTDAVKPGRNVVVIRADHSKINELFLGGIVRPILLIDAGE